MNEERTVVFTAVVTRQLDESDGDLTDRIERAAYLMVQDAPFSGYEGVRFYPGRIIKGGHPDDD